MAVAFERWLLGAILALLTGCPSTPTPSPCSIDPVGCRSNNNIAIVCQRDGSLDVQIGTGEAAFTAIDATHGFQVHHGVQGGEHVFVALRVTNPALDHPQLAVSISVFDKTDAEIGLRQLTIGPPLPQVQLPGQASPAVEQAGIVVFGTLLETGTRMHVTVKDPCGRVGEAETAFHQ